MAVKNIINNLQSQLPDINGPYTHSLFIGNGDDSVWLKISAGDPNRYSDFYGTYKSFNDNIDGYNDNVFQLGHNMGTGGGVVIAGRAALGDAWESHFDGGHVQQERHLKWVDRDGYETRFISFEGHEDDGSTSLFIDSTDISLGSGRNSNTFPSIAITPSDTEIRSPGQRVYGRFDDAGGGIVTVAAVDGYNVTKTQLIVSALGQAEISTSLVGRLSDLANGGLPSFQWNASEAQVLSPDNATQIVVVNSQISMNVNSVLTMALQPSQVFIPNKLLYVQKDAVVTNTRGDQIAAILTRNTTAATSGATQQFSPSIVQTGYGWTGSANRAVSFETQVQPDGSGNGKFVWLYSNDEANYSEVASLTNAGKLTVLGDISADGYTISPANGTAGQALVYNGTAYVPSNIVNALSVTSNLTETSNTGSITIDLNTTGVSPGTYQGIAIDAYGRITSASLISINTIAGQLVGGGNLNASLTLGLDAYGTAGIYTTATGDQFSFDAYGREAAVTTVIRNVNTTARLTGGGNLTSDLTIDLATFGTAGTYSFGDGYVTFDAYGRESSAASATNIVTTSTAVNTTAPLAGGGNLSSSLTLSIPQAATSTDGYLSQTDWNTFNNKLSSAFYQIVKMNGGADLTQRNVLNFLSRLTAVDDSIDGYTNVDLATSGVTASTYNYGNGAIAFDAYGRATSASSATNLALTSDLNNYLLLAGGTMSGAINMDGYDITNTGNVYPATNDGYSLGSGSNNWKDGYITTTHSSWFDTKMGAQLTAAATITPTSGLHHVTGATTIDNIATTNVPSASTVELTLIADGGTITLSNAGNIKVGVGIPVDTAQKLVWDGSFWYLVA